MTPSPSPDPGAGILLTNVGSPAAPTIRAVRAYLREFLADPLVVDAPRLPWWLVRNLIILPFRAPRSARRYRSIWSDAGSPLVVTSELQSKALAAEVEDRLGYRVPVVPAMRYGEPSLETGLSLLAEAGCRRVILLPLFPQFSNTTVGTTRVAVDDAVKRMREPLEIRTVAGYPDHPAYIRALAASVREKRTQLGPPPHLVISFHGLPSRYAEAGDPYPEQCRTTAELLAGDLDLDPAQWTMCFQSRFGREEWLRPYAGETLEDLGYSGIDGVDVICPGFAADCLETLEEMDVTNRRLFGEAGGRGFRYIAALNDRADHVRALADLVEPFLK